MADTLGNISLNAGVWTDLYAESGIDVGTKIVVQNIGVCDVFLTTKLTSPTSEDARQVLERAKYVTNEARDSGAWAICPNSGGALNVRLA